MAFFFIQLVHKDTNNEEFPMNNTLPVAAAIVIAFGFTLTAVASPPQITTRAQSTPRMPAFTEPAVEASNPAYAQSMPLMTINIRNRWRFDCYAPATVEECTKAGMAVQKAYTNLGRSATPAKVAGQSGFGTPKWQTNCYMDPKLCNKAIDRLKLVVMKD